MVRVKNAIAMVHTHPHTHTQKVLEWLSWCSLLVKYSMMCIHIIFNMWDVFKVISVDQARLNFLNEMSELKSYGGKAFSATMMVRDAFWYLIATFRHEIH